MASVPETLFNEIYSYLLSEGYEYTQYQNEQVFKKGVGLVSGPTFVKVSFQGNMVCLEAWMKFAVVPGVYAGEYGLTDLVGAVAKGPLKSRVAYIEFLIQRYGGSPMFSPAAYPPAMPVQPGPGRFCTRCGAPLAPDAAFCTNCGNAV